MTEDPGAKSWYLAQIKPNSHRIALRNLARQGIQTFLPLHSETRQVRGQYSHQMRPLFPGYLFVALDPQQGQWRAVNATPGLTRIVLFGGTPARVPHGMIDGLMQRCDADGKLLPPAALSPDALRPGDKVALTTGPFAELIATIETITPDQRIWMLMDIMGSQTRVAIARADLRKL